MTLESRILCAPGGLSPLACVFATQLATVPLFALSFGLGRQPGVAMPEQDDTLVVQSGTALGTVWTIAGLLQAAGFAAGASASHGAFLTQMTTLFVPLFQMTRGDKLPPQILLGCVLALPGIACFAADAGAAGSSSTLIGDALCG